MCELFGVSAPEKIYLNDLLKEFFSHGYAHPNGWGMAFFYGDGVSLEKEPVRSPDSSYLKYRLRFRIEASRMIAHIRLATRGTMDYENTHPFVRRDDTGRAWTLAHNGTIFECDPLNKFVYTQDGATDSERILLYILEQVNRTTQEAGRPLTAQERFLLLDRIVHEIAPENKINLLIYDGELLYAHTNLKNTLYFCRRNGGAVFSTVPLDRSRWEPVPMNTLLALENGKLRFTGKTHAHEFFPTEEKMRYLFLDYSAL